jgi:hypothetical protein
MERQRLNRFVLWGAVIFLVILHQDYWQWNSASLLLGFFPYALAYHAALSLLAAAVWWAVATYFWPTELEFDEASAESSAPADTSTAAEGETS